MTVAIVQARMASTRLPGKVMLEAASKPLLAHVVERVLACEEIADVIVATTNLPEDQVILDWCNAQKLKCVGWTRVMPDGRNDVLARFALASQLIAATSYVRVTADCPCWAPELGAEVIRAHHDDWTVRLASNVTATVDGFDTEVFDGLLLADANGRAQDGDDRQHVTPMMYRMVRRAFVDHRDKVGGYKLSVDTEEDFLFVQYVLEHVKNFSWQETIRCAREYTC